MDLKGKVAIVTGGANGIGKAISNGFLNSGMKVCICDVNEPAAKSFLQELSVGLKSNAIFVRCDVSSAEEFRAAFEKTKSTFGKIDVLVNNAGIMNEHNWKKMIDVNLAGAIHGIKLALEFMGTNNGGSGGSIINISSGGGLFHFEYGPVYSATKYGMIGLTRSYGHPYHFDRTGVTVNAVCPGAIDTPLFKVFPTGTVDEASCKAVYQDTKIQ